MNTKIIPAHTNKKLTNMNGMNKDISLKSVFKVAKSATREEIQNAFRKIFKDDSFILDDYYYEQFMELNNAASIRFHEVQKIAGKFYEEYNNRTDSDGLKKKKELSYLCNYIYDTGEKMNIISIGESPDFILEKDNVKIAIELVSVVDEAVIAEINAFDSVFKKTEEILRANNPNVKKLFNVIIDPSKVVLKNKSLLPEVCAKYIQSVIDNNCITRPDFITDIIINPQIDLQVCLSEIYFSNNLSTDNIVTAIREKEKKYEEYRHNSGLSTIWLLIITDGASAKSDVDIDISKLPTENILFDKVIVYNSFKRKILEGVKTM